MTETLVCRLTAAGRSAVAVVGLYGSHAEEFISICFEPATNAPWRVGQIRYGIWRPCHAANVEPNDGESVVLTPMAEDHFEIHGHGGAAAVSRIMDSLVQLGAKPVDASTWNQRLRGRHSELSEPLIAEAEWVLRQCTTRVNAAIALHQYCGALLQWTQDWIERLGRHPESLGELKTSAAELWQRRTIGRHLTAPYRVVLAGPPNVGKSSLVNRIVGYGRSITHDEAGTTRDVVDCDTVINGLPVRLGDTAGIRSGGGVIEREGIRRGSLAIGAADLILIVVDPTTVSERAAIERSIGELTSSAKILRVLNKSDCIHANTLGSGIDDGWIQTIATPLSSDASAEREEAEGSDGINELIAAIAKRLRPQTLTDRTPIPVNTRQVRWIELIADAGDTKSAMVFLQNLRSGAESI